MVDLMTPQGTFVDWDGNAHTVYDIREVPMDAAVLGVPSYFLQQGIVPLRTVDGQGDATALDEIASRASCYGEGAEDLAHLIFDANMDAISSADFDLSQVRSLVVPRQQ